PRRLRQSAMTPDLLGIEPEYSASEREELGHLDYLSRRVGDLFNRGLIGADAHATVTAESQERVEAIGRQGRCRAALGRAQSLAKSEPRCALEWAERARALEPGSADAWERVVSLHWELGEDDQAIARCSEAAARFPMFQREHERLLAMRDAREVARRRLRETNRVEEAVAAALSEARKAVEEQRD